MQSIQLVDVDEAVTRQLLASGRQARFSEAFAGAPVPSYVVGPGDTVEIFIWEAPPAMLFGSMMAGSLSGSRSLPSSPAPVTTVPAQMVATDGTINIPFAGRVPVAGQTPEWVEAEIARRLKGRANQPQVLVQVVRNATSTVTVLGEVNTSARVPLTAKGERLLDMLAAAGGIKQTVPIEKVSVQLTRGDKVQTMALEAILRDPRQNIVMQPGDLLAALYQPLSFTALGAVSKSGEVSFEAQGISLAQALGRAGGLDDMRADARAVFIFRLEDKTALNWQAPPAATPEGKVPVIYEVNLRDPAAFFVAQSFPVRNGDVLYVSNSPAAELQKFVNIIATGATPLVDAAIIKNAVR